MSVLVVLLAGSELSVPVADGFNITLMFAEVLSLQLAVTDSVKIPVDNTFIVCLSESSIFKYLSDIGVLLTLSAFVCPVAPSVPASPP